MRISIRHETRYDYGEPMGGVVMRLNLMPASNNAQSVQRWAVSVNGKPIERWVVNGYGDSEAIWRAPGRVDSVTVVAEGDVRTIDTAGVILPFIGEARPQLFLRSTPLTQISDALTAFAERARSPDGNLASLHQLCDLVHEEIAYRADSTTVETTAAQALVQGWGVCQDQAHIFVAAARSLGIPARYVTGYLHDPERPGEDHVPHAWAEAHVEGLGWVGFDSTLGSCPIDGHVRMTCGLDAADAAPIRGVMAGSEMKLSYDVQIASLPLENGGQAQTQQ